MFDKLIPRRYQDTCPEYHGFCIISPKPNETHVEPRKAAARLRKSVAILVYAQQWIDVVINSNDVDPLIVCPRDVTRSASIIIDFLGDRSAYWNNGERMRPAHVVLDCFNNIYDHLNVLQSTIKSLSSGPVAIAQSKPLRARLISEVKAISEALSDALRLMQAMSQRRPSSALTPDRATKHFPQDKIDLIAEVMNSRTRIAVEPVDVELDSDNEECHERPRSVAATPPQLSIPDGVFKRFTIALQDDDPERPLAFLSAPESPQIEVRPHHRRNVSSISKLEKLDENCETLPSPSVRSETDTVRANPITIALKPLESEELQAARASWESLTDAYQHDAIFMSAADSPVQAASAQKLHYEKPTVLVKSKRGSANTSNRSSIQPPDTVTAALEKEIAALRIHKRNSSSAVSTKSSIASTSSPSPTFSRNCVSAQSTRSYHEHDRPASVNLVQRKRSDTWILDESGLLCLDKSIRYTLNDLARLQKLFGRQMEQVAIKATKVQVSRNRLSSEIYHDGAAWRFVA